MTPREKMLIIYLMPRRLTPLVTDEIYHVFNRGIDRRPTFLTVTEYRRAIALINYYHYAEIPGRYSDFIVLSTEIQEQILKKLAQENKLLVEILSYCLMPNHFHLLLKQNVDKGISQFMANWQNSYTRYHNLRHERTGPLFVDQFKAVRIETEEQLLHVSRYIHLNPFSGSIIKSLPELANYPWSSLNQFLKFKTGLCSTSMILGNFSKKSFAKFIFNQADYQQKLEAIKHLLQE